eukprot:m.53450 g.53450  ORF g.53450 m.53450 type:complete len:91 (-) comp6483_c0_seq1:1585-1857(-)
MDRITQRPTAWYGFFVPDTLTIQRVRTPPTLKFTLNEILVEPEELDLKESLSDPGTLATYVKNLRDYKKQLDAEQERHRKSGLLLGLIRS